VDLLALLVPFAGETLEPAHDALAGGMSVWWSNWGRHAARAQGKLC
jgi:hypothetical protein